MHDFSKNKGKEVSIKVNRAGFYSAIGLFLSGRSLNVPPTTNIYRAGNSLALC